MDTESGMELAMKKAMKSELETLLVIKLMEDIDQLDLDVCTYDDLVFIAS